MAARRPVYLNLFKIRLPLPGVVSIMHRASGAALSLAVVLSAAFVLRVADALPRVALGVPRGVERASDVAGLERASGLRMPVPAYFPDSLEWPPAELRTHTGGSAAIWCRQRPAGPVALIVATTRIVAVALVALEQRRGLGDHGRR